MTTITRRSPFVLSLASSSSSVVLLLIIALLILMMEQTTITTAFVLIHNNNNNNNNVARLSSMPIIKSSSSPSSSQQHHHHSIILLNKPTATTLSSSSTTSCSSRLLLLASSSSSSDNNSSGNASNNKNVEVKAAKQVTGEELELMLQEWDTPLVLDAYATWCGPCLLMAPEYEEAAKVYKGKVRFVKLDTDKEEQMAARLNIMGLPTLLFLDQYVPPEGSTDEGAAGGGAKAVLKGRIEGAMRKQNIIDLIEFYFFQGPEPKIF